MTTPEYEITHAAIRYALQCMLDGNWHALREMGFCLLYTSDAADEN